MPQNHIITGAKGSQGKTATAWLLYDIFRHRQVFEIEGQNQYRLSQMLSANGNALKTVQIAAPAADELRTDPAAARDVYAPAFEALLEEGVLVDLGAGYECPFFEAAEAFDHPSLCADGADLHFVLSALAGERLSHAYTAKLIKQSRTMYPKAAVTAVVWEASSAGGRFVDGDEKAFNEADTTLIAEPCISKVAPLVYYNGALTPTEIVQDKADLDTLTKLMSETAGKPISRMVVRAEMNRLRNWTSGVLAQFNEAFANKKAAA
jgi:hypothetical protein